jgi:hypothetical protein
MTGLAIRERTLLKLDFQVGVLALVCFGLRTFPLRLGPSSDLRTPVQVAVGYFPFLDPDLFRKGALFSDCEQSFRTAKCSLCFYVCGPAAVCNLSAGPPDRGPRRKSDGKNGFLCAIAVCPGYDIDNHGMEYM